MLYRKMANIPRVQSSPNFFMNAILICDGCPQIFELFHLLTEFITCLYADICLAYWSRDMNNYLVSSAFTSRPVSTFASGGDRNMAVVIEVFHNIGLSFIRTLTHIAATSVVRNMIINSIHCSC